MRESDRRLGAALRAEAAAAGGAAAAAESAWLRSLEECQCRPPLLDRTYMGRLACRLCGKLRERRRLDIGSSAGTVDGPGRTGAGLPGYCRASGAPAGQGAPGAWGTFSAYGPACE